MSAQPHAVRPPIGTHGKRKLVLVGNGMAGMRAVEELLALAPDMYDITVFGAEPHGNYNRILLSPVLASEKTDRGHHAQHARVVRRARHHAASPATRS